MAAVRVADIGTKRGDLDLQGGSVARVFGDHDDSELRAHGQTLREKLLHLFRGRVGCDIVVGWFALEQDIAYAAADEIGLMARSAQVAADALGECAGTHGHKYEGKLTVLLRADSQDQTGDVVV